MGIDYKQFDWVLDRQKRKAYLSEIKENEPENKDADAILKIMEYRYTEKKKITADNFIGLWLNIVMIDKEGAGTRKTGGYKEFMRFIDSGIQEDAQAFGEEGKAALHHELLSSALLYLTSCLNDRAYGSRAFGIMQMDKKDTLAKINMEAAGIIERVPKALKLEQEMKFISSAFAEAYDMFLKKNAD